MNVNYQLSIIHCQLDMEYIRLGKTNLLVSRIAVGAMRLSADSGEENAALIVRKAYDSGINFFDTSGTTPESEKLLGDALYDIRNNVLISTTTNAKTPVEIKENIENSLMTLHCDNVDLYQFETDDFLPEAGGADGIYDTLVELRKSGKAKHIGIVTVNMDCAVKAVTSGLYETLQFPFSMISPSEVTELIKLCEQNDVGFIAMQPLGGGLIENIPLALGYISQFESVVPIWGIQSQDELSHILYFNEHPPVIDEKFNTDVEKVRMFFN